MVEFLTSPLGLTIGGGVVAILLAIVGKYITPEKVEAWGEAHGTWSTALGSSKLGKATWNKIENYGQTLRKAYFKGYDRGADSDDK